MKIQVRIGANEFSAEGPEDIVKDQYAQFLKAIGADPPQQQKSNRIRFVLGKGAKGLGGIRVDSAGRIILPVHPNAKTSLTHEMLHVVYGPPIAEVSSLMLVSLGPSAAMSLMMLLYGFWVRLGLRSVSGLMLLTAAQQSGMALDRVDRELEVPIRDGLVVSDGERRGKQYALTDGGVVGVERLLHAWSGKGKR